jgi:NAD(P)H-hydrate epimerase
MSFQTQEGRSVAAVTAEQMRDVDRVAVEEVRLELLMMMENAGRNMAEAVYDRLDIPGCDVFSGEYLVELIEE